MIDKQKQSCRIQSLEVMHNCPDVFEKMFGQCKQVKLTDVSHVKN